MTALSISGSTDTNQRAVALSEAGRQLEQAVHDARVAFDCIGLGELRRAHTHAITSRAAVDAAENILRTVTGSDGSLADDIDI
ncbi:MAG TPA: hypothetical protein VH637_26400 [Streptosporangiaceae bacterium]